MAGGLSLHSRDLSAGTLDKSQSWGARKGKHEIIKLEIVMLGQIFTKQYAANKFVRSGS